MVDTKKIKSASIILQRSNGEVFLAKRNNQVSFFPGFWVFPGGKIEDPLPESWDGCEFEVIETIYKELYEEVGVVVGSDYIVPPDERKQSFLIQPYDDEKRREFKAEMTYVGKKDTPPFRKKIYSAAYYHIKGTLVDELDPVVDNGELVEGEWIQPEVAISQWMRGEKRIPPPILHLLRNLLSDHFATISLSETFLPIGLQTKIEFAPGIQAIPIYSDTIDPFFTTNLIIIGQSHPIIVDPGANSEGEEHLRQLLLSLDGEPTVVITHHHPDHWAGLDVVQDIFPQCQVLAHSNTISQINTELEMKAVSDSYEIETDVGKVEIIYLPGHTDGHIGLMYRDQKVLVAGDHVVGYGSAVLDPRTGSMVEYFESTHKLLEEDIELIIPAHGPPNFNPQKLLQGYLDHRLKREEAIWTAVQNGSRTLDEIVKVVYTDVPEEMWEYAKRNIQLHLEKLAKERDLPKQIEM